MTRRSGTSRTTDAAESRRPEEQPYPSLRQRNPVAYWVAITGAAILVLSTIASFISAFL